MERAISQSIESQKLDEMPSKPWKALHTRLIGSETQSMDPRDVCQSLGGKSFEEVGSIGRSILFYFLLFHFASAEALRVPLSNTPSSLVTSVLLVKWSTLFHKFILRISLPW